MQVTWQKFHEDGQTVEVQFFAPDAPSNKLILFCPGFPGRGGTMFEQRHAAALVKFRGHTVGVIKHAGTRIDGPDAPFMINNGARLMESRQKGEAHLGGGPSTMAKWLKEPLIVMDKLRDAFAHIDIIGNSFGAVSALWSLIQPSAPLDKIRTVLFLAGAQGLDTDPFTGIMRLWSPMILSTPAIWEKIELDSSNSISDTMKQAYADITEKARHLPHSIELQYLVVENDELLNLSDTEHFKQQVMGGRGHIHIDKLSRQHPSYGLMAHDTPDLPTEKLMELLHDH